MSSQSELNRAYLMTLNPRVPISATTIQQPHGGDAMCYWLVVVCDDGSVWHYNSSGAANLDGEWLQVTPLPGTPAEILAEESASEDSEDS